MAQLTFEKMQEMQKIMHEKHKGKWTGLSPETAMEKLLWLYGEVGEACDIIKKQGVSAVNDGGEARARFVEEMIDVLMYFNDIMICFNVSPQELAKAYEDKFNYNLKR